MEIKTTKCVRGRGGKSVIYIAVCDDEKYCRQNLKGLVSGYLRKKEIPHQIDMFCSGEDFLSSGIELMKYTVIFLDINMAGKNGIQVAKEIRAMSRDVFIVFVTASYDYMLEGYKVDAVRYLMKDGNQDIFRTVIDECMDAIIEKMNYVVVRKQFGFKEGSREISLERLIYIQSNLHRLFFCVMEETQKSYTLYETLDRLEKNLEGNHFVRIHQSYLVNMKHIKSVSRYKVTLSNQSELFISRKRYMQVKEAFATYQGRV